MPAAPLQLDPDAVCDSCGTHGAYRFDGETLCADCYAARGSCCSAEFSGRVEPEPAQPTPSASPAPVEKNPRPRTRVKPPS